MTSPRYLTTTGGTEDVWTQTHTLTLPSERVVGEHVVLSFGIDGSGGTVSDPAGWESVLSEDLNSNQKWRVWIRELDGSEPDTVTVTTGKNNVSAHQFLRFNNTRAGVTEGTTWDVEKTQSGNGSTMSPPAITASWGAADNTVVALGWAGGRSPSVTSFPSGFSNGDSETRRVTVMSATKELSSDATDDPDAFVLSNSNNNRAATLILREAAGVLAGAGLAAGSGTGHDATCLPPTVTAQAGVASASGAAIWARPQAQQVDVDLVVEVDWDGDGDFDETVEDITSLVLSGSSVRGRDYASQVTGRSTPGEISLVLNNEDGRFSNFNEASPLNNDPFSMKTGRLVRVRDSAASVADPVELVRDLFAGNGPITETDTGETYTARTTATWSEFAGELQADGPPDSTSGVAPSAEDPAALAWTPLDNSTAFSFALRPASGQTISLRSSSELTVTGTATSHNITAPATIEADDTLLILVATQDNPTAPAAQVSGFTQRDYHAGVSAFRPAITILEKTATGSEDSSTLSIGWGGGAYDCHAVMFAFDGVDTGTPFDVTPPAMVESTSNPDPPSITATTGGALVVAGAAGNRSPNTSAATIPAGYSTLFDQTTDSRAFVVAGKTVGSAGGDGGTEHIATFDCGQNSYYAQLQYPDKDTTNEVGWCFYWTDDDNYGLVYHKDGTLYLDEVVSGSQSTLASVGAENRTQINIGVETDGSTVTVFLDGVEEMSETTTLTATSELGPFCRWFAQRPPRINDLRVWDKTRIGLDSSGVLATMRLTRVRAAVRTDGSKIATLTATGRLGQLERPISAPSSTGPDDLQSAGVRAGHMVGNVLARVGALHPPSAIAEGDTLGSFGFSRQRAISLARRAEETELGFLWETRDGAVSFDDRAAREGSTVTATFTDDSRVPGFNPENVELRDWEGDVINRVRSEVSPSLPRQIFIDTDFAVTNTGVQNDVAITIPDEGTGLDEAAIGDLLLVAVASTVAADGVLWESPPGWTPLTPSTESIGLRVYARRLEANDFGDSVTFYDDSGAAGGGWLAVLTLVKNWYGVIDAGVHMTEVSGVGGDTAEARAGDNNPPVIFTPWTTSPTLFLALRAGFGGATNSTVSDSTDDNAPPGFDSLGGFKVDGVANAQDAGLQWARRIRSQQVYDPDPFGGVFTGFGQVDTAIVAVRGFAGSPPPASGGFGVTSQNTASQLERDAILDHPSPGILFEDIDDAETYNDLVLTRYAEDRPIVSFNYSTTKSRQHRNMRLAADLSDRVRVDVDGRSGHGFDREFHIETIIDEWTPRLWRTTYECSPVAEAGGGSDVR